MVEVSLCLSFSQFDIFCYQNRGAGYTFGSLVVEKFLQENGMDHILRAHQLCMEGFQVLFDDQLSTVWSAPNYCYRCGNLASILEVGINGERHFNVFEAAPENERPSPSEAQRSLFGSNGNVTGGGGGGGLFAGNGMNGGSMAYAASAGLDSSQVREEMHWCSFVACWDVICVYGSITILFFIMLGCYPLLPVGGQNFLGQKSNKNEENVV